MFRIFSLPNYQLHVLLLYFSKKNNDFFQPPYIFKKPNTKHQKCFPNKPNMFVNQPKICFNWLKCLYTIQFRIYTLSGTMMTFETSKTRKYYKNYDNAATSDIVALRDICPVPSSVHCAINFLVIQNLNTVRQTSVDEQHWVEM